MNMTRPTSTIVAALLAGAVPSLPNLHSYHPPNDWRATDDAEGLARLGCWYAVGECTPSVDDLQFCDVLGRQKVSNANVHIVESADGNGGDWRDCDPHCTGE